MRVDAMYMTTNIIDERNEDELEDYVEVEDIETDIGGDEVLRNFSVQRQ